MPQFDVHRSPAARHHEGIPYLLNIQSDHLDYLKVRVVVPLLRSDGRDVMVRQLNPKFEVENVSVVMITQLIGGMPAMALGEVVANLADQRTEIIGAIDNLVTGI
jgi:toxin CcdB